MNDWHQNKYDASEWVELTLTVFQLKRANRLTLFPPKDNSDSEDEAIRENLRHGIEEKHYENDFDMMMARKKEENSSRRRRKNNVDIINDNEEYIAEIVRKVSCR